MVSEYPISEFPISETIDAGYTAENTFTFSATVSVQRTAVGDLGDLLQLEQTLNYFVSPHLRQTVNLKQYVNYVLGLNTNNTHLLTINQLVTYQHIKNRTAINALYFFQETDYKKSIHSIIQSLVFADIVDVSQRKLLWQLSQTLVFTQELNTIGLHTGNTLEFEQTATTNMKFFVITHELNFTELLRPVRRQLTPLFVQQFALTQTVRSNIQAYGASNSFIFTDTAVNHWVYGAVSDTLTFAAGITKVFPIREYLADVLTLTDSMRENLLFESKEQELIFSQELDLRRSFYVDLCQCLYLDDTLARLRSYSVSQSFSFTYTVGQPLHQTLLFSQSVVHNGITLCCKDSYIPDKASGTKFAMTQAVGLKRVYNRTFTPSFTLRQTVIYRRS